MNIKKISTKNKLIIVVSIILFLWNLFAGLRTFIFSRPASGAILYIVLFIFIAILYGNAIEKILHKNQNLSKTEFVIWSIVTILLLIGIVTVAYYFNVIL